MHNLGDETLAKAWVRVSKQHLRDTYNGKYPKRAKKAKKAKSTLRTTRLVSELDRTLSDELKQAYQEQISLFW